ncbi:MAG: hypothetical protein JKY08_06365 [Flavobacteriaceae bacterium]|nr:hypothetical protein [Flavobacteriaceae bacterium]
MKRNIISILLVLITLNSFAQKKQEYSIELTSHFSSKETLPFWMVSNKHGSVPNSNNGMVIFGIQKAIENTSSKNWQFGYGAQFTGGITKENDVMINQLYTSIRYKKIQLDLGVKHNATIFEGLSSSNGNIAESGNSRSLPGYNIQLTEYIKLPFAKKWLTFKGQYGDYLMNDPRYIDKTRLHKKSLFFKALLNEKWHLTAGLTHYAQWAGSGNTGENPPRNIKDYLRVISGKSGGENAIDNEKINALGNHIGSYLLQGTYKGITKNIHFYYSHPFEDRSGREFTNWRDGIYGLFIDFKETSAVVSHLLTEFTYTKHMSGSTTGFKNEKGELVQKSGRDNYFNNSVYRSGWTYFGNGISSPYFTTREMDSNGFTEGFKDNRFMAFNIGVKGLIKTIEYKAILSHTTYIGWFDNEYDPKLTQFSGYIECKLPSIKKLPIDIILGSSFDTGTYRPVNVGGFISLRKTGLF